MFLVHCGCYLELKLVHSKIIIIIPKSHGVSEPIAVFTHTPLAQELLDSHVLNYYIYPM